MAVAARSKVERMLPADISAAEDARLEVTAPQSRGPLRPAALSPVRTRLTGGLLRSTFRTLDAAVLALVFAVIALQASWQACWPFAIAAVLTMLLLPGVGGYVYEPKESLLRAAGRAAAAVLLAQAPTFALQWSAARTSLHFTPEWILLSLAAMALTHVASLAQVRRWRRLGRLTPNILMVGATENAGRLIEAALATHEVAVLGIFDDRSDRIAQTVAGVPVLGDTAALLRHRILPYVDRIVLTVNAAGPARTAELIERLRVLPNELCLFMDGEDPESRTTTLSWLARSALSVGGAGERDSRRFAKRVQDLVLGSLLLIPALPIMGLIALAVRLDSPGPVLFRQRRHGFNNEVISVWKFRSMRADAADQLGARQVTVDDDRVTRMGRFIRRTSLDELPQLINVLQGRMSLVGPRPHPVGMKTAGEDCARLVAEYAWRHRMKPGITGWAQINGSRGAVQTAEQVRRRVELDVDYIERQSFWLDIYIMLMTLPRLLGDADAVR